MTKLTHAFLVVTSFIVLSSCQKGRESKLNDSLTVPITQQSQEKQFAYVKENLLAAAKELGLVMKDPAFKKLIHEEVAKKFDGQNEVLLKTLVEHPRYAALLNTERMKKARNAFKNISGENFYPQIYIPNFQKFLASNTQARTTTDDAPAEFVINDGNEEVTSVPSYTYNEDGQIVPTGTIVNEQYALNNEIYIISINEVVQDDGSVPNVTNGSSGTTGTQGIANFRIKEMYIKDSKESWLSGSSEINMKAVLATWNSREGGASNGAVRTYSSLRYAASDNYKGHHIADVRRSEVYFAPGTINYPLQTDWSVDNFYSDQVAYAYVIFEYDPWPAGTKTAASKIISSPDEKFAYLNFRSSQTSYLGDHFGYERNVNYAIYGNRNPYSPGSSGWNQYFDPYVIDSWDVKFTTEKY